LLETDFEIQQHLSSKKIALIHYWYVRHRGGERVLDVLAETFPKADIFVMVLDPKSLPAATASHKITTSFLQKFPGAKSHYRKMMFLFPFALESFNLDDYDIVISQEAGPAKGVLTRSHTCHINYCHSPMRYIWDKYHEYRQAAPGMLGRFAYSLSAHYLRQWDYCAAARVHHFIASSANAASRIWKYYRRESEIIYPPVDLLSFLGSEKREDFYLVVSPLVVYKRVDLAIRACNQLRRRLVIIGRGEDEKKLRKVAGPTIEFLGYQSDEVVRDHYRRCRAFVFPGEEDIGLTPIEAQASGAPVIAFGRGGALETVRGSFVHEDILEGSTGVFFESHSVESLVQAILFFETNEPLFRERDMEINASRFDVPHFKASIINSVYHAWKQFNREPSSNREVSVPLMSSDSRNLKEESF
jgi:glycosyltransferase involved in cell wall biosynthesis